MIDIKQGNPGFSIVLVSVAKARLLLVLNLIHIVFLNVYVVTVCYRLLPFPVYKFEELSF